MFDYDPDHSMNNQGCYCDECIGRGDSVWITHSNGKVSNVTVAALVDDLKEMRNG